MVPSHQGGSVILLNGTSSSGKTSIARSLQQVLEGIYLHVEVDRWRDMHPEADVRKRTTGMVSLLQAIPPSLAVLAAAGNNLIIDDIFGVGQARNYAQAFQDFSVLYVGVCCRISVVEERERQRGNRDIGTARGLYEFVYSEARYDMTVDTGTHTPDECARLIKARWESDAIPEAMKSLMVSV